MTFDNSSAADPRVNSEALYGDRLKTLGEMLTYRRPAWSRTEEAFIKRFIRPLGSYADLFGNHYVRVGTAPILWSCHTDTVHHDGGRQDVAFKNGFFKLPKGSTSNCLGADCTAGVFLMTEMIKAGVEGLYVFHRAEEVGGRGSAWIAKNAPQVLSGIRYAIAFDRFGYESIITHQWGRTCSDAFADSLNAALEFNFKRDDGGIFTDTANYTDLVGECTNLSVGYFRHHSAEEEQDADFLISLLDLLCRADFSGLVQRRQPGEVELDEWYGRSSPKGADDWTGYRDFRDEEDIRFAEEQDLFDFVGRRDGRVGVHRSALRSIEDLVREFPGEVAEYLRENGVSFGELLQEVSARGGDIIH